MKIINIYCRVMGVPGPDEVTIRRNWVFVFVETDAGITGIGEATTEWHELAVVAMIDEHLRPRLVGEDPTRIEYLWQAMHRGFWWRGGVVATSAISGIDQALWDITGKAYGVPVYKLLGGAVREQIRLYARDDLGLGNVVDEARAAIEEGFDAFKGGIEPVVEPFNERCQINAIVTEYDRLRDAVGSSVDLMIDCAEIFSQQYAAQLISRLRRLDMLFIEEPVGTGSSDALVELRSMFPDVRIAAGERLCTRWAFREWLEKRVVDVIQADVSHTGGISELVKIARSAEVYGVRLAPHSPYGPVALAASAHACAVMSNFLILEHCRLRPWFDKVQIFGPTIRDGHVVLDNRPGLGIDLNLDVILQFPYRPLSPRRIVAE